MSDELSIPRNPVYRVPRRRGPDIMTRRLLLIAGGLSSVLVAIVVAWSSVGHHAGQVPVVQADQRPVRVKPANPGGMQIPGLSADTGVGTATASADALAPAPETPDPQALARQPPRPAPAPLASGTIASGPITAAATPGTVPRGTAAPAGAGPASVGTVRRVVAGAAPAMPAATESSLAAARPSQLATAAEADRSAASPAERAPVGRTQVQLAAVGTETAARLEWHQLVHRMPGVLGTHHPVFSKVEHDGRTLWRVRTGEFATEAEAGQFCHEVKAKGGGCTVAVF